jgi:hypothetical protein
MHLLRFGRDDDYLYHRTFKMAHSVVKNVSGI